MVLFEQKNTEHLAKEFRRKCIPLFPQGVQYIVQLTSGVLVHHFMKETSIFFTSPVRSKIALLVASSTVNFSDSMVLLL